MSGELAKYGRVKINEPLARHCTWRIGGPADVFVEPAGKEQLAELIGFLNSTRQAWMVIGFGSNLLFDDRGFRGVVVKIGRAFSRVQIHGTRAVCQPGIWVPQLARRFCNAGLSGLEHAVGIPGSLGGLVVMNGGSRRQCIGTVVEYAEAITPDGRTRRLSWSQCAFGYRSSIFQKTGLVITELGLRCEGADPAVIRREMLGILKERRNKFPLKQPSCGSVFLSDPGQYARLGSPGAIIDKMGLKGFRVGGAQVSGLHANFIINAGGATSRDVLELVRVIQEKVRETFAVELQCEFRYVSEDGQIGKR
jgi:UDP-N-acetylmuramate dehydrogenase